MQNGNHQVRLVRIPNPSSFASSFNNKVDYYAVFFSTFFLLTCQCSISVSYSVTYLRCINTFLLVLVPIYTHYPLFLVFVVISIFSDELSHYKCLFSSFEWIQAPFTPHKRYKFGYLSIFNLINVLTDFNSMKNERGRKKV